MYIFKVCNTLGMTNFLFLGTIILTMISNVILEEVLLPDWAVKVIAGEEIAREIALKNDLQFLGKVGNLENIFHFKEKTHSTNRSKRSVTSKTKVLQDHHQVSWVQHQKNLVRIKRSTIPPKIQYQEDVDNEIKHMFNDPQWLNEWYLYDNRKSRTSFKQDLDVIPVWKMNITGRGVKVTIIDDGIEHTHPDLHANYDPHSSTDLNDDDDDPFPNLAPGTSNEHGTRCASEVAMVANNKICGVGIAYNSKIGGIRILDGSVNDMIEAKSLGFNNNHIDIYSASWGPTDDGKTMEGPGPLVQEALIQGVTKGRNGKGSIYVWATGNGGYFNDSCACDGYVSSIYAISINSISPYSSQPGFTEGCSSTIASTFSTSAHYKSKLIAADVHGSCTKDHSGTSASAPYAAAIVALALEANPKLTWRDIKHLLAWTSQPNALHGRVEWQHNAAGFWVNDFFGFGEIDALNFVKHALSWKTVPEMKECKLTKQISSRISNTNRTSIVFDGDSCSTKVKYIEHVIVNTTFQYSFRGALQITLTSPHGMKTILLPERGFDKSDARMTNWPFNSIFNWGENPQGKWTVTFEDKKADSELRSGTVDAISMTFIGTETIPQHVELSPIHRRNYDANYNHVMESKRNAKSSSL